MSGRYFFSRCNQGKEVLVVINLESSMRPAAGIEHIGLIAGFSTFCGSMGQHGDVSTGGLVQGFDLHSSGPLLSSFFSRQFVGSACCYAAFFFLATVVYFAAFLVAVLEVDGG